MSWKQGRYLRTHTLSHLVTHPLTASAHILSHLLTLTAPPPPSQSPLFKRYAVAMIQEMFMQIDYNGDGGSDWNEFTTFLSLTGLRYD